MLLLDLQFFADEGGDSSLATSAESVEADASAAEADTATAEESVESEPTFDELIKGKYKKDYDNAVKGVLNKRFKNQADLQGKIDSLSPILDMVSSRYGVQRKRNGDFDVEALTQKIEEDNSMWEQEAFERGVDVETLKEMKKLERQNESLKAREQERQNREGFERLVQQAEQAKAFYPDLDLEIEMMDEDFGRLIANGIDVKTAYEVRHHDDIMTSSMQYAVQHTKENISRNIQAGHRPQENGTNASSSSSVGSVDVSKLTLKDLEDIKRRAANGEHITFA